METSTDKLPFLDILICKKEKEIFTDIYYKGTDSHQYLDFHSCHPKHTKNNIPYTLARRICAIVKREDTKDKRLTELHEFLRKQNYPDELIRKGIEKAKKLNVHELRAPKKTLNNNRVLPLVFTHNPNNPNIVGKVKENIQFLSNNAKMKTTLEKTEVIVSRRQPKNLKRILTKAQFSSKNVTPTVSKCNEPKCGTCDVIITGETVKFKNGKTWTVKTSMNCKSRDVVYVVICPKCNKFYVGQSQNLRNRVTLHKEQIKHERYRHLPVSKHLANCNNGKFTIMPIYQSKDSNRIGLESIENKIISILHPELNCDTMMT